MFLGVEECPCQGFLTDFEEDFHFAPHLFDGKVPYKVSFYDLSKLLCLFTIFLAIGLLQVPNVFNELYWKYCPNIFVAKKITLY